MAQADPEVGLSSFALALWDQLQRELFDELSRERQKSTNLVSKIETTEEERKELAEIVQKQKLELENKDQMVARLEKEKDQLSLQLSLQNNTFMVNQAKILREQANLLANDAHTRRISEIAALHPPSVVPNTQSCLSTFKFSNPTHVTELLPIKTTLTHFSSTPVHQELCRFSCRVWATVVSGYWFDPRDVPKSEFDLLIETSSDVHSNRWTYYGRFVTKKLDPSAFMEVSEWIAIDETTRRSYITEAFSRGLTSGQLATPEQVDTLMGQVDSGEKIVPCYLLQWMGYSINLCKAFTDVINTLIPRHEPGHSTMTFYSLRHCSKRSEPATSAKDVRADNQIRKKPRLWVS
ncbi:hypothetical protein DFS33DRAFT_1378187 [Desarmillaria ectypa]|nr:hypothetical protein DFS33DRAFT_1378187 [Desarmillaria ectypa]